MRDKRSRPSSIFSYFKEKKTLGIGAEIESSRVPERREKHGRAMVCNNGDAVWNRVWRWRTAQVLRNRIFRATRNNRRWPSRRRRPPTARPATTTFISNRTVLCHRKVRLVASNISLKKKKTYSSFNFFRRKNENLLRKE